MSSSRPAAAPGNLLDVYVLNPRHRPAKWKLLGGGGGFTKPPANPGTCCSFRTTGIEVNEYDLRVREIQIEALTTLFCDFRQVT